MAVYEHPLNEKIRLFSRLEFLIHRFNFYMENPKPENCQSALMVLLELYNLSSRLDVKSATLNVLDWQTQALQRMAELEEADKEKLQEILDKLDSRAKRLHEFRGQLGQHLKGHSFLNMLKQRSMIAGGVNGFDVPVFNYWYTRSEADRVADLKGWVEPFLIAHDAISVVLELVRHSGNQVNQVARDGFYQATLNGNREYQLLRIELPDNVHYFPEVSAGKQRFSVRFVNADTLEERSKQIVEDIEFSLTLCSL
ncbi:cell division protein ZapD [Leucothrix pacifica]|uniref:Cell division protein ZapD n=1 Tax=Leucothrix pacifica TaxID=1247513 RepID=A0A317C8B1_9GAMM|nr:cell division protein ZapD [Leucothrix pacifica]PWQ92372.1 cell division protein ZapD [Leucothrix pacifica]